MNIHMNRATDPAAVGEIDIETMKRYISYCKAYVPPDLSRSSDRRHDLTLFA